MYSFMTIRELYELAIDQLPMEMDGIHQIELQGWIRTNRASKNVGFIELNDGTYFKNAQLVYPSELDNFEDVKKLLVGSAISIQGKFVLTPDMKQPFEVQVDKVTLEGSADNSYPLQKKRHSFEYLREISHLRMRTNTFECRLQSPFRFIHGHS